MWVYLTMTFEHPSPWGPCSTFLSFRIRLWRMRNLKSLPRDHAALDETPQIPRCARNDSGCAPFGTTPGPCKDSWWWKGSERGLHRCDGLNLYQVFGLANSEITNRVLVGGLTDWNSSSRTLRTAAEYSMLVI